MTDNIYRSALEKYTDEELRAEMDRREKEKDKKPEPKEEIDWSKLIECVKEGVTILDEEGYEQNDFEHYVFEAAMTAVYGDEIWDWWNKKLG